MLEIQLLSIEKVAKVDYNCKKYGHWHKCFSQWKNIY